MEIHLADVRGTHLQHPLNPLAGILDEVFGVVGRPDPLIGNDGAIVEFLDVENHLGLPFIPGSFLSAYSRGGRILTV